MIKFAQDKDINDLIPAVILTIGAIQQAKQGLPACEAIDNTMWNEAKMEQSFDLMKFPTRHFSVEENDVMINGTGIKDDILRAVAAYEHADYEKFGEIMGEIAKLATEEKVETVSIASEITKENVAEVAQGMLKSTGVGSFDLEALLICIYEEDQAALILYEGVQILEEAYADKDIGEAIGGVIAMVAFVQQFKQGLPACEAIDTTPQDWVKFNNMVSVAESPAKHMKQIGKDIVMNGVTITKEVGAALESFRSGNFEQFGEQIGDALMKATEPAAAAPISKKNVAEVAQGMLKATGVGSFNLEALLLCIYSEDQAALILYEGV